MMKQSLPDNNNIIYDFF